MGEADDLDLPPSHRDPHRERDRCDLRLRLRHDSGQVMGIVDVLRQQIEKLLDAPPLEWDGDQ